jgi:D-alanyl-D-alanine dipeptidase
VVPRFRHLCQIFSCAFLATGFALANETSLPQVTESQTLKTFEAPSSFFSAIWSLPIFRLFAPIAPPVAEFVPVPELVQEISACDVAPLQEIEDEQALAFENSSGSFAAVDVDGLTAQAQVALARFQRIVSSAGGSLSITSAYRPGAYQEHLQSVWDKWMVELRRNTDPDCQELRAEVRDEFEKHTLLESQRPATTSDHTRGLSFDANVRLPFIRSKKGKRRIGVDALALRAGLRRPHIAQDPVHFRVVN